MANHKSTKKRIRSSKQKTRSNKHVISSLRTCQKSLLKSIENKEKKDLENQLKLLFKLSDRAVKKGVMKKNAAARKKSRFSIKIQQAQAQV